MSRCWSSFSRRPRRSRASACSISASAPGSRRFPMPGRSGPSGHVTGADISRPMLDAARRRVDEAGLKNVELILADAQVHAFAPDSYDLLTSRLGVMFFADPGRRLPQPDPGAAAGRPAGHGGVGDDRREPALEDPVRYRGAPSRAAGAATAARAGAARLRRPRLSALDPRRRPVLPRSRSRRGRFTSASIRPRRRPSTQFRPASCSG